jgi:hypothetical protein
MSTQMTTPKDSQEGNPDEKYQITTPTGNKPQMATLDDNPDDNTNGKLVMSSGDVIYVVVWFVTWVVIWGYHLGLSSGLPSGSSGAVLSESSSGLSSGAFSHLVLSSGLSFLGSLSVGVVIGGFSYGAVI